MTLSDYIYATYNELLTAGWRMCDIDAMDLLGYLRVRIWAIKREKKKNEPKTRVHFYTNQIIHQSKRATAMK